MEVVLGEHDKPDEALWFVHEQVLESDHDAYNVLGRYGAVRT